uniref:Uncharacterized protein n=1 Tax=Avena sativa TaxID=4498 RepID=A0ACD5YD54_AVESA
MEDWSKVYTSIGFGNGDNTIKILSFSYYDLPCHLRPCLLHLSIFSEDSEIMKDTLIWKWIAEGFVAEEHGVGLFEIGERYFNELMNRSMILPVENGLSYTIYACRVHDMVLDMICLLSNEQNFVTILDNKEKYLASQSNPRRLAIQTKDKEQHNPLASTCMPKLRSCYANMCHISVMPSLSSFQVLRVLDMEGCGSLRDCHLKHLGRLLQLRYLSLEDTPISELPEDIGDLRFLQSLFLNGTEIKELPQSIGLLRKLKHLRVDSGVPMIEPNWIGNLTSLEEIHFHIIGQCSIFMKELGKLIELRVLVCCLHEELDKCSQKTFVESICNLPKIQVLKISSSIQRSKWVADGYWPGYERPEPPRQDDYWPERPRQDDYWQGYEPPRQLCELAILWGIFSSLPAWINSSLLPNLYYLQVRVDLEEQDWLILGSLPELRYVSRKIPGGMEFYCGAFPNLRRCDITAPFRFFPGSMQSLDFIYIKVCLEDASTDFDFIGSLGNLPSLRVVQADINYWRACASDAEEVEAAFRRAMDTHPNRPTLKLKRHGKVKEEEESDSGQTAQESHNGVREGPDSEQSSPNQDQSHEDKEAEASGASDSAPADEREGDDGLAETSAAASVEVQLSQSVGTSAQVIDDYGEEEESQADQLEQDKVCEAEDGSAEQTASEGQRSVEEVHPDRPVSGLAESREAAGSQVPARRTWRKWACFACLDCGTTPASSKQCGTSGGESGRG